VIYTSPKSSIEYRSARSAIYLILDAITRMLAPILTFTSEEIWTVLPGQREESVHLAKAPAKNNWRDAELEERYEQLQKVRGAVSKSLEIARSEKRIGQSLEAKVLLNAPQALLPLLQEYLPLLPSYFIVSQVELCETLDGATTAEGIEDLQLRVDAADGEKCERCWNYVTSVGENKEHPQACQRCVDALAVG
jgi:isoleucyl-tRNA synthetase